MFHLYPIAPRPMLHERLKELRQVLKFSQDRMAEVLGMSQTAYCNLEKGHTQRLPSEDRLRRLVRRAGVSFDWLFGDPAAPTGTHAAEHSCPACDQLRREIELKDRTIRHLLSEVERIQDEGVNPGHLRPRIVR